MTAFSFYHLEINDLKNALNKSKENPYLPLVKNQLFIKKCDILSKIKL
jgi:hypothetical protein